MGSGYTIMWAVAEPSRVPVAVAVAVPAYGQWLYRHMGDGCTYMGTGRAIIWAVAVPKLTYEWWLYLHNNGEVAVPSY